jgi:hypothetical protein
MDGAWVGVIGGLAGVLLGSGLAEFFKRSNRIENYAPRVFEKRMQIYEELFRKLTDGQAVAEEIMKSDKHSAEERHAMISAVVLDLAEYCDANALYLNEELTLHCVGTFMGSEDVADIKNSRKQNEAAQHVRENVKSAKQMIKAEAGIEKLNRFFGRMTRSKLSSPLIDRYRELRKN